MTAMLVSLSFASGGHSFNCKRNIHANATRPKITPMRISGFEIGPSFSSADRTTSPIAADVARDFPKSGAQSNSHAIGSITRMSGIA